MNVRQLLRRLGFDVVRYPYGHLKQEVRIVDHWKQNRFRLMFHHNIDLVIDVGANEGQFGEELRSHGYMSEIVSFEPLLSAFQKLKLKSDKDSFWDVYNFALGSENSSGEINIAGNSQSSSLLEMQVIHQLSAPESAYIGKQVVEIRKLDDIFLKFEKNSNIFLKLDVQGFEREVFRGLENNLKKIKGIQIEMSLIELYKGEATFFEQCAFLRSAGFRLMSLEPGFFNSDTGQLLQVDGIWYR